MNWTHVFLLGNWLQDSQHLQRGGGGSPAAISTACFGPMTLAHAAHEDFLQIAGFLSTSRRTTPLCVCWGPLAKHLQLLAPWPVLGSKHRRHFLVSSQPNSSSLAPRAKLCHLPVFRISGCVVLCLNHALESVLPQRK